MSRIFISYKRVDKDKVFKIKDQIEAALGEKCWIDLDGIESDAVFANKIISAINDCDVFLFMYSKTHKKIEDYENDWTIRELNFAQMQKKRIVFINIDGSELTDWFKLLFGTKQQVDGMSQVSLNKLYKDLGEWIESDCQSERDLPNGEMQREDYHKEWQVENVPTDTINSFNELWVKLPNIKWYIIIAVLIVTTGAVGYSLYSNNHEISYPQTLSEDSTTVNIVSEYPVMANDGTVIYKWTGELTKQNLPTGEGVATFEANDIQGRMEYRGKMHDGQFESAKAILLYRNGSRYEGSFENGKRNYGILTLKEDEMYFDGSFKEDKEYNGKWYFLQTKEIYSEIKNGKEFIK